MSFKLKPKPKTLDPELERAPLDKGVILILLVSYAAVQKVPYGVDELAVAGGLECHRGAVESICAAAKNRRAGG